MEKIAQVSIQKKGHAPLGAGISWGLVGGLAGTLVMDFLLMAGLSAVGLPALSCFTIVGDTVAQLLSNLGIAATGGVPLGVAAHYLVGPLLGGIFGLVVTQAPALRVGRHKKRILLAVVYVQLVSQPILASTPILLEMTTPQTLQWFGISTVMHLFYGLVLGVVTSFGVGGAFGHRSAWHSRLFTAAK